jgi:hypothetical protein
MAISTLCPGCQSLFRLPDDLAGKQVRCQQCGRLMMVPGVLSAPAKVPLPPKAPVYPEPTPAVVLPPRPPAAEPPATPALSAPAGDGLPAVVLVEVPVKPAPPPLPETVDMPRPVQPAPVEPRRPGPTMTLARNDRGRRATNRPRRPTSVLAGLLLGAMLVLFVILGGASLITWMATEIRSRPQQMGGPMVQMPPPPIMPQPPRPPQQPPIGKQQGRNRPKFIDPLPPGFNQPGMGQNGETPLSGAQGTTQVFNAVPAAGFKFDDRLAKRIKLQNGNFTTTDVITNNDTQDPLRRWQRGFPLPSKVYLVELQKGKRYVIDYRRTRNFGNAVGDFDPYLRIESLDGTRLVEGDDVVGQQDLNSRVEFHPAQTATYRIICTAFQNPPRAAEQFTLTISERPIWLPKIGNRPAPPRPRVPNDRFTITPITEKGVQASVLLRAPTRPIGDVCWSADGRSFFVMYNDGAGGVLLKCGLDGFASQRRLDIRGVPGKLAMSAQGLVVSLPAADELLLIDPDDLQVKRSFDVALRRNSDALAASPELDYVYVAGAPEFAANYPDQYGVAIVNLNAKGKGAVRFYDLPNTALAMSPKGDYLFALENDILVSFKVDARTGDIERKQTSHLFRRTIDAYRRIDFSPDNRYVCVSGVGVPNVVRQANPKYRETAVLALPLDDLRKPAFAIETDMLVHAVAFDPTDADTIYSEADQGPLAIYDHNGQRKSVFDLVAVGNEQSPRQLLVHPDGKRVLIRFGDRLCFAALAIGKAAPVVKNVPNWPVPMPVIDGDSMAGDTVKRGKYLYRALQLPNLGDVDPVWDADGRSLFHLETDGTLTRLSAPDFVPRERLTLGQPAAAMALSAQGLLVALRDQAEVWVINPRTLQVQSAITCPAPAKNLAAHPQQSVAVALGAEPTLLDLKAGRVTARGLQAHPDAKLAFHGPTLSPDGRYLFLAHAGGGDSKVLRVRVSPKELAIEDSRNTEVKGLHAFCVTADSKYVAWYTPNVAAKEPTEFYAVGDWKAPAFNLRDRARMIAPVSDAELYVQTTGFDLQYLSRPADKDWKPVSLPLPAGRLRIRNLAVQPQMAAFIASTGTQVYYGQLPVELLK